MCTVTIKDMEQAVKDMEAKGYKDVKVVACPYWSYRE